MQDEKMPSAIENDSSARPKSQQRIRYEAQLQALKKKHGGLEALRRRLGFSQKQMCELLLVDASAWSRWIKPNEDAPAHIYQALDWYIEAHEHRQKFEPQLKEATFIEDHEARELTANIQDKLTDWEHEKNQLLEKIKKNDQLQAGWKIFLILNSFVLLYLIMTQFLSL